VAAYEAAHERCKFRENGVKGSCVAGRVWTRSGADRVRESRHARRDRIGTEMGTAEPAVS
jgi:hypothetical protein